MVADNRNTGIRYLPDFHVIHIVAFHDNPDDHAALMGMDQSVANAPQV